MSHAPLRALRAALLLAALAILALPGGALAKPKHKPKAKPPCPSVVPAGKGCKKGKPKVTSPPTKVTVKLIAPSNAVVDIPAVPLPGGYVLPGTPATRTIGLGGSIAGSIPVYLLGKDNNFTLTSGQIPLEAATLLTDAACGDASVLDLSSASAATLDPKQPGKATIFKDGRVEAVVNVVLNLAFGSRTGTGCADPLVPMGRSQTPLQVKVKGAIDKATGLTSLKLDSDPINTSVNVCLTPGAPDQPCASWPVAYPVTITVHPTVSVAIGG